MPEFPSLSSTILLKFIDRGLYSLNSEAKLGKYTIIEELGRGGYGIVYKAQDSLLERYVALKVLHPNLVNDLTFVSQFLHEAKLASQLDHPNIVPVFDFDQKEGRYYIAMGLMGRGSLKDQLNKNGTMTPVQVKAILEQVTSGLAYAHEHHIIHRDLKPGNILIDDKGNARVSDFGFAKAMRGSSVSMSVSGGLLGTPSYMAPEIWEGKPASPASDIYSLGCIIYEMLSGDVLFDGETPAQIMHAHLVRGALQLENQSRIWQTVLDNCLQRDPSLRYSSTITLFEDLRWELLQDDGRNQGFISISNELSDSNRRPIDMFSRFKSLGRLGTGIINDIQLSHDGSLFAIASSTGIHLYDSSSLEQKGVVASDLYLNSVSYSVDGKTLASGSKDAIVRFWEVKSGSETLNKHDHSSSVECVRFSPNGKWIATSDSSSIILWELPGKTIYNVLKEHTPFLGFNFSPNSKLIAYLSFSSFLTLWDVTRGLTQKTIKSNYSLRSKPVFSPDSKLISVGSGDNVVKIWNTSNLNIEKSLQYQDRSQKYVAFSPDNKMFAVGNNEHKLQVWDISTGILGKTLTANTQPLMSVVFSLDGNRLLSASSQEMILWDVFSSQKINEVSAYNDAVNSVAFSPDGKFLVSGHDDGNVAIWDIFSRKKLSSFKGDRFIVDQVLFSPDCKRIAIKSLFIVSICDVETGFEISRLIDDEGMINDVLFTPDGNRLFTINHLGKVKLWAISNGVKEVTLINSLGRELSLSVFSPNANKVTSVAEYSTIIQRDLLEKTETINLTTDNNEAIQSLAISIDNDSIAFGGEYGTIWILNTNFGLKRLSGHTSRVVCLAFSPDNKLIVSGCGKGIIRVWSVESGELVQEIVGHTSYVSSLTFSQDGHTLASGSADGTIQLWDIR